MRPASVTAEVCTEEFLHHSTSTSQTHPEDDIEDVHSLLTKTSTSCIHTTSREISDLFMTALPNLLPSHSKTSTSTFALASPSDTLSTLFFLHHIQTAKSSSGKPILTCFEFHLKLKRDLQVRQRQASKGLSDASKRCLCEAPKNDHVVAKGVDGWEEEVVNTTGPFVHAC